MCGPVLPRGGALWGRGPPRRTAAGRVHPTATAARGEGTLTVDAYDAQGAFRNGAALRLEVATPGGRLIEPALLLTAPGRYRAGFSTAAPGGYELTLTELTGNGTTTRQRLGLSVPYGDELAIPGADLEALAALSEATGGALLSGDDPAADMALMRRGEDTRTTQHPLWPYLVAGLVFLFILDIAYRQFNRTAA